MMLKFIKTFTNNATGTANKIIEETEKEHIQTSENKNNLSKINSTKRMFLFGYIEPISKVLVSINNKFPILDYIKNKKTSIIITTSTIFAIIVIFLLYDNFLSAKSQYKKAVMLRKEAFTERPRNRMSEKYVKAFNLLQQAAARNYAPAQHELGQAYYSSEGVELAWDEKRKQKILSLYEKSAAQGYAPAMTSLGGAYYVGEYGVNKNIKTAEMWFTKAAKLGDATAAEFLAGLYRTQGDKENELYWLKKADKLGNPMATIELAEIYEKGLLGQKIDKDKALKLYKKAAKFGGTFALKKLADWYADQKDYKQMFYWVEKLAQKGDEKYQENVGILYLSGTGTKKDIKKALFWLKKSADAGSPTAQFRLGSIFLQGELVPRDIDEGMKWYKKASKKNHPEATYLYAYHLITNKKDIFMGTLLLRKAAELGVPDAQYEIGRFYMTGTIVDKNLYEAIKWFRKAAAQGHAESRAILYRLSY